MSLVDLHLHTTYSDGSYTPREILDRAHKAAVSVLAITDHDCIDSNTEALALGKEFEIEVIPGVEISAKHRGQELHILGYYLNITDPTLRGRLANLRATRHGRITQILKKLNELGLVITYDHVLKVANEGSLGRPHVAQVLQEKGYVHTIREAFDRFLGKGAAAFVEGDLPSATTVIAWITEAGGVPVLAHPFSIREHADTFFETCKDLKGNGLKGIEAFYSSHTPRQTSKVLEIARQLDLLNTGGSDFHGFLKPGVEIGRGRGNLKVPKKIVDQLKDAASRC